MRTRLIIIITALVAGAMGQYTTYDVNAQLDNGILRTIARSRLRNRSRGRRRDRSDEGLWHLLSIDE